MCVCEFIGRILKSDANWQCVGFNTVHRLYSYIAFHLGETAIWY